MMEKTYDPQSIEQRWYRIWEEKGWFAPATGDAPAYCIMIPPPNVTGTLHMGHAFQDTIMDALTRYHRMLGDRTLWQPGTDHAGIATQIVVERQLNAEQKTRHDLGREAFVERVWQWRERSGGTITRQLRRMGASVDWSRERFTMDEGLSRAVTEVFVTLFEQGLIYRGKRLVNWDPVLHTAVSDLEVLSQEESGSLWHMRYPLTNGSGDLVVATTRPETMLGDSAVAVHPDDERYKHLLGEFVELPLTNRRIPIIADDYVDPEFGTGCVKITPAHDFNDYQVWLRHRDMTALADQAHGGLINIFTVDAAVRENAPQEGELIPPSYVGLDRYEARERIVADLQAGGFLEKIEDHKLMVPRGDRSGAVIEPLLTDQWYVRVEPLAKRAIEAVERGDIRFVPDNWKNTYFDWMHNIEDWCISRQIWWGHRIPAWYDDQGNVYVGRSEDEVRERHALGFDFRLRQDEDVLDTWFSSALWPFSTLGWPEGTEALETYYPTNVLVTGFDIIFFWVARMIMMGLKFMEDVPFREVYVTGLIRDEHGNKMSKSKGNVLDPVDMIDGISVDDLIDKRTSGLMQPWLTERISTATRSSFPDGIAPHGADALRFTLAALASTGRDINWDMKRLEGYRNFCNKLWNAARFVLMNTEGHDCGQAGGDKELNSADRWIEAELARTMGAVTRAIEGYRFDQAAQLLYEFIWNEYCDWYLELSKTVLQSEAASEAAARGTRHTLIGVLEATLRLLHPIMPFITEELWQRVAPLAAVEGETIMLQPWPRPRDEASDRAAVEDIEWLKEFVLGVRRIRAEYDIEPRRPLPLLLQGGDARDRQRQARLDGFLTSLARAGSIDWLDDGAQAPESATALVGELKLLIPLAGLIDKDAELKRLGRDMDKLRADLERSTAKLNNPRFVERAPGDVVDKERRRVEDMNSALAKLEQQAARISAL